MSGLASLPGFDVALPFLLIFSLSYGILQKIKIFSDSAVVNGIISFAVAAIFTSFELLSGALFTLVPIFVIFIFVLFILILIYMFTGASLQEISKVFKKGYIIILLVGVVVSLILLGLQEVFVESFAPEPIEWANASGNFTAREGEIIRGYYFERGMSGFSYIMAHPKVIGTIVLVAILIIISVMITYRPGK